MSIMQQMEVVWEREEKFWAQKSKISWLKDGDRNTKFFHSSTIRRRKRNKVVKIRNGAGEWLERENEIAAQFGSFYRNLFTVGSVAGVDDILEVVPRVISDEDNLGLCEPVHDSEIRSVVFELGKCKAPGPDGFTGSFFSRHGRLWSLRFVEWLKVSLMKVLVWDL